ncbi:MAG: GPW/gp25 family protein [Acinetobacter sp.]|jgi:phage baseplate assembly protein W|uniref:GPW/gp25 family protein n=1 Tax=Acinetobacter guillouiae TaxID=106649 RepID=UPI00125063FB|nr:GPW/gp25 family protein [Acinetobacter guillouiae]MDN5641340.1 GPW/gp25 family protein [Acinetobacter sp.]
MKGMHRSTGKAITDNDSFPEHLYQSMHDILSTLIGTRLCRRNYGSLVPHLIDQPCNDFTKLQIMNASATALIRFEPRIKISQVQVSQAAAVVGYWLITILGNIKTITGTQTVKQEFLIGAAT